MLKKHTKKQIYFNFALEGYFSIPTKVSENLFIDADFRKE